ncbi:MAG: hypothetical protein AAF591_08050 [Verrucomicrobiota bacterium]
MTAIGLLAATLSFLLAAYFLVVYFTSGIEVLGWTPLALLLLFFGGAILASLGLLGEYLGRVLLNINRIPQFVVAERTTSSNNSSGTPTSQ